MKRILNLCFVLFTLCALSVTAFALDSSGSADVSKMSKAEIKSLVESTAFSDNDIWYEVPSVSSYNAGRLKDDYQTKALERMNALRKLAGVKSVELYNVYCELAQHCALIEACIGDDLSHKPECPAGMSEETYILASAGASSSNLSAGVGFSDIVDYLVSDKYGRNIESVGHRRWMFNPVMSKTGFGYVEQLNTKYKKFGAVYAIDQHGDALDYKFIAWPSSGNFPSNIAAFDIDTPWSVQLNPAIYGRLEGKEITVVLTRESDGKTWEFSSDEKYIVSETGKWMNVDKTVYGSTQCIVFRPDNVVSYEGIYTVKMTVGSEHIEYSVDFFNTETFDGDASDSTSAYSDVPSTHWASAYIQEAAQDGAVNGVGDNKFNPDASVTSYELATIILRGLYHEVIAPPADLPWYHSVDTIAQQYGLWDGIMSSDKNTAISRYDMAVIIYNVLLDRNVDLTAVGPSGMTDVDELSCMDAVNACVSFGILQGTGPNQFDGDACMTRAQAAAIYCRMKSLLTF